MGFFDDFDAAWTALYYELNNKITPRNSQVIALACRDCSADKASKLLGTSPKTISNQITDAVKRLGYINKKHMVMDMKRRYPNIFYEIS